MPASQSDSGNTEKSSGTQLSRSALAQYRKADGGHQRGWGIEVAQQAVQRRRDRFQCFIASVIERPVAGTHTEVPFIDAARLMTFRSTVDFLLHDGIGVESLTSRPRFAEHTRETFDSVIDACQRIARDKLAPANRIADLDEPTFDGEKVRLPQSTIDAVRAQADSGIIAAAQDYEVGGMQLPCTVQMACTATFAKASLPISAYVGLTRGNASLLMVHGTPLQKQVFAENELSGRWLGTMCLSEPQVGSSLSDITTRAEPDGEAASKLENST